MSSHSYYSGQYHGNKIVFPEESFLIAGISFYQDKLANIQYDSLLKMEPEIHEKDSNAIRVTFNNETIGYVPNKHNYKTLCLQKINSNLKIITIKKDPETKNYGIRVILEEFFTDDLKDVGIF